MLDLYEELKSLVRRLEETGTEYALCGGLAMAVHGVPRATVDIDILVPPGNLARVEELVRGLGFTIEANPMSFAGGEVRIRRFSKIDPDSEDVLSLDIVLVTDALEEVWRDRAPLEWEEGPLTVVDKRGLIRMKRLRGSDQDGADIRALQERSDEG